MFGVEWKAARERWIENYDEEDGSSIESLSVGEVQRSRQRYESMRERSIVGGASTGNMGGWVYTRDQGDGFWVHYNFLSSFGHPTRRALLNYSPYTDGKAPELALETLVLDYVGQFEAMLIRIVTEFFSRVNRSADFSRYASLAEKLEEATKDFWFIFNEASNLDKEESERQMAKRETVPAKAEHILSRFQNPSFSVSLYPDVLLLRRLLFGHQ